MGGCTSKPKVLKDDAAEAPEPAPENVELIEGKEEEELRTEAAVVEEGKKEETETVAPVVEEKEEIEGEAIDSNPQQESSSVTEEKVVAVDQIAEQVKEMNELEGKDSTQSDTVTALKDEPEVVKNEEAEEAKSEINPSPTADPPEVETKKVNIPAVEEEENVEKLEKKLDEEKIETQEKKKQEQEDQGKPQPENNPIVSFISSLMGQKR